jgi:hypothetical protein
MAKVMHRRPRTSKLTCRGYLRGTGTTTVAFHTWLGTADCAQAAVLALRHGLVDLSDESRWE